MDRILKQLERALVAGEWWEVKASLQSVVDWFVRENRLGKSPSVQLGGNRWLPKRREGDPAPSFTELYNRAKKCGFELVAFDHIGVSSTSKHYELWREDEAVCPFHARDLESIEAILDCSGVESHEPST